MRAHVISAAAILTLLVAGSALAQTSPQTGADPHHPAGQSTPLTWPPAMPGAQLGMPAGGGMMGGADMGRMMSMMHGNAMMAGMGSRHIEGRIAFLKAELKITHSQDAQWAKYADALRANAGNAPSPMPSMMSGTMGPSSAPDMLDRQEQTLVKSLAAVRGIKGALAPLYQALTGDQKKLADELLAGPMGMM